MTELDISVSMNSAFGPGAEAGKGRWKNQPGTREQFIPFLLAHAEDSSKDGLSFTQGEVANKARNAKSMIANHIIGFDLDNGETKEEIVERLSEFSYAFALYSTHSHMNDTSEIKRDHFFDWCDGDPSKDADPETVAQYLTQVKGYLPRIVGNLTIMKEAQPTDHGVIIVVKHKPIPKWRIIFFLSEPFVFQGQVSDTQKKLIEEWRELYHGFGSALGFQYDQKCTDPSRLYYAPRHKKGSPFVAEFYEGGPVDLRKYPRTKMSRRRGASAPSNAFSAAAEDLGQGQDERERYSLNGKSLKRWVAKYGEGFEISHALLLEAPEEIIREEPAEGKLIVECPFEGEHSKSGGMGFYCVNAGDNQDRSPGFVAHCSHDGCAGRDRLDFLKKMVELEWLSNDALTNPEYQILEVEPDSTDQNTIKKPKLTKREKKAAKRFDALMAEAVACPAKDMDVAEKVGVAILEDDKISRLKKEVLLGELAKAVKVPAGMLKAAVKKGVNSAMEDDDSLMKKLDGYNKAFAMVDVEGKPRVLKEGERLHLIEPDGFLKIYGTDKHEISTSEGTKLEKVPKIWMEWEGRRTYVNGIVFEPGLKLKHSYNLFKGFSTPAIKKGGGWDTLEHHMFENICEGNDIYMDWLVTWLAQPIQHPRKKMGSAVALRGSKGAGKSKLFDWYREILNPYSFKTAQSKHVTGSFNAHLMGNLFVQVEEGFFAGDTAQNSALKDLITSTSMMMEPKGVNAFPVSNYTRLGITSNEEWVVPASLTDERRFFVLDVGDDNRGDIPFFQQIDKEMKSGGLERMMWDLKNWSVPNSISDSGSWNVLRTPPVTDALLTQGEHTMTPWANFFKNFLDNGGCDVVDDVYRVAIHLNEDKETIVPSAILRKHFDMSMSRAITTTARNKTGNAAIFGKLVQDYLFCDTARLMSVKGTVYNIHPDVRADNRMYCYTVPPLKKLRELSFKKNNLRIISHA